MQDAWMANRLALSEPQFVQFVLSSVEQRFGVLAERVCAYLVSIGRATFLEIFRHVRHRSRTEPPYHADAVCPSCCMSFKLYVIQAVCPSCCCIRFLKQLCSAQTHPLLTKFSNVPAFENFEKVALGRLGVVDIT